MTTTAPEKMTDYYLRELAGELESQAKVLQCLATAIRHTGATEEADNVLWDAKARISALASAHYQLTCGDLRRAMEFWHSAKPEAVTESEEEPIRPTHSPLRWFGSKFRMLPILQSLIPAHHTWVDAFFGGGGVTMAKPPSPVEVVNDLDGEVCNFFRVIQRRETAERLYCMAALTPYSREWFEEMRDCRGAWEEEPADDLERAYRFFCVNRASYSGAMKHWSFSVALGKGDVAASVRVWLKGVDSLMPASRRLRQVQIERMDFRRILETYDTPDTCFYLDPPYIPETRVRGGYRHEMTGEDHADLVDLLLTRQGMSLLSGYAHELYEPLERQGWERRDYETRVFMSGKGAKKNRRVESVWLCPKTQKRLSSRQLPLFADAAMAEVA